MKYLSFTLLLTILGSCFIWEGCTNSYSGNLNEQEIAPISTRRQLFRSMRKKKQITFVYGTGHPQFGKLYQEIIDSIASSPRSFSQITVKADTEIQQSDLDSSILFIVGSLQSNKLLQKFEGKIPFYNTAEGFSFEDQAFDQPDQVFKLYVYPNAYNPQNPIMVVSGNSDEAVYRFLVDNYSDDWSGLFWRSMGYEVYQGEHAIQMGYLSDTSWQFNPDTHFDFTNISDTVHLTKHFCFIAQGHELSADSVQQLSAICEATLQKILDFTGKNSFPGIIHYHLYPTLEQKGLMLANTALSHSSRGSNQTHSVLNEYFNGSLLQSENEIIVHRLLGASGHLALEKGLSIYFTENWQKKGYAFWASKLYQSDNLPPLKELLNNQLFQIESPLIFGASAASFVAFLIDHWGKDKFLEKYGDWAPNEAEVNSLNQAWRLYLKENSVNIAASAPPLFNTFQKGFNFAHEGYRIYNGYGSGKAAKALKKLGQIGTNTIAIVPYSYMPNPNKPSYIDITQDAWSENDEASVFPHYVGGEMGMSSLLKPQIWLGSDSWPGDLQMKSEEDWQQFFDFYYRWIRHYAILAEIHDVDVFCLGVEFAKATLEREADWRKLIKKIRGIFDGHLTYAANWGEEFENLAFWDELDYIGLNCYYPLSTKDQPAKEELARQFQEVLNKAEKVCKQYDKPLLFTEIGFRSVDQPWKNPHAEPEGRDFNANHQALCYEVVFEAIENKDWIHGIYWWKWPSYLEYRGMENTGFTPNNKTAEKVVSSWFSKL